MLIGLPGGGNTPHRINKDTTKEISQSARSCKNKQRFEVYQSVFYYLRRETA